MRQMRGIALTKPIKDGLWLAFVKEHPCCLCGAREVSPHHIFGSVHGMKSADLFTAPLCLRCHERIQAMPLDSDGNVACLLVWVGLVREYLNL